MARRRAIAFCGALSQLMPPFTVLACAIPVLSALRFDARIGLGVAAIGAAAASWIVYSLAPTVMPGTFVGIALMFFGPLAAGAAAEAHRLAEPVLPGGRAQHRRCCWQSCTSCWPIRSRVWKPLLMQLLDSMQTAGLKIEGDRRGARCAVGALDVGRARRACAWRRVFGSLLLGRWWDTLLRAPGAFGAEYRNLRLGIALGVTVTVVFVLAMTTDSPLISALAWVAFVALAFQGLAAAHRSRAGGRLNRGWLAAIYLLLVVPLSMMLTMFVLAIWGFADNWLRPRRPASL